MATRATTGGVLGLLGLLLLLGCGAGDGGAVGADAAQPGDVVAADAAPDLAPDADPADTRVTPEVVVAPTGAEPLTHLIVTTRALAPAFGRLAAWRARLGVASRVETMEDQVAATPGRDPAERLRNRIKAVRAAHPELQYVLLGGDDPAVPARVIYVWTDTYGWYDTDDHAASELYYADLDGTWDGDGDGTYGEITDGLDMKPDLAVGRLPVDTLAEAQAVVDKLLTYEGTPAAGYLDRILLISEPTGYYDIDSCLLLDKWEQQILPADAEVTKLYEDDMGGCQGTFPHTDTHEIGQFERGQGLTIHLGHGVESWLAYLTRDQVVALDNAPYYPVYVSCACYAGNFAGAGPDSVGEEWVLNPRGGGVVYMGNTSIGIGYPPGQRFIGYVIDAWFQKGLTRLGDAWLDAFRAYPPAPSPLGKDGDPYRYTNQVLVLLGDPAMQVWLHEPGTLATTLDIQGSTAQATITADGAPRAGATLICALGAGATLVAETDAQGQATLVLPADVGADACQWSVTATGHKPLLDP